MSAEIIRLNTSRPKTAKPRRPDDSMAWYQAFGARLRAARLTFGISEVEAADALLTTLRTYRRREAGLPSRGGTDGLVSFAQKYDLSLSWLIGGAGPMRRAEYDALLRQYIRQHKLGPTLTLVGDRT